MNERHLSNVIQAAQAPTSRVTITCQSREGNVARVHVPSHNVPALLAFLQGLVEPAGAPAAPQSEPTIEQPTSFTEE
jgi:hypothetical protein